MAKSGITDEDAGRPAGPGRGTSRLTAVLVGLVAAGTLLTGCGGGQSKAKPMDDEFAGSKAESSKAPEDGGADSGPSGGEGTPTASPRDGRKAATADTGRYQDGTYALTGTYGEEGSDHIDVDLELAGGSVKTVKVEGRTQSPISRKHIDEFIKAVPGVVQGKPLKDLKVGKVAGASWTSDAFNKALDLARLEASAQEG